MVILRVFVRPPKALPNMSDRFITPIRAAGHAGDLEIRHRRGGILDLDLDFLVIKQAIAQFLAEAVTGRGSGTWSHQSVEHAFLCCAMGLGPYILAASFTGKRNGGLDEIADNLVHITADIAHFGEFRCLDLDEGSIGEFGKAAGNLGLADAGWPDHQDVFGQHFVSQIVIKLLPAPAVAQRDGHGALGVSLADDEAIKLGNNFARRENWSWDGSRVLKKGYRGRCWAKPQASSTSSVRVIIGVNADFRSNAHGLAGNGFCIHVRIH